VRGAARRRRLVIDGEGRAVRAATRSAASDLVVAENATRLDARQSEFARLLLLLLLLTHTYTHAGSLSTRSQRFVGDRAQTVRRRPIAARE